MPNLTLKDIPERLHKQLRERAKRNGRSVSEEAIACLERAVTPTPRRIDAAAILAKARALRRGIKPVSHREIDRWINRGRL